MSENSIEESIFDAARQLADPAERTAYLNRTCRNDGPLRARIDLLLSAYGEGAFLESPAGDFARSTEPPIVREQPGAMIGPYKLLEQIGEGGMGLVFMAEQSQPIRRRVALKIIKPGLDTKAVIARFEAERQALALMEHPNIARVFDAGTTDSGRPYFVMELVRGVPITEYCSQHRLDLEGRLELFIEDCQAVQHAHQKAIIHRDLKPMNILVAHDDTTPVPKVIDFGVAKATNQALTEQTLFTRFAQVVGTPLYMSPEQAELNYRDVDTRSDVYSLGVVLYELLTGTTPFDAERLQSVSPDEMRWIIRNEEPVKPSTRATTLAQAVSTINGQPAAVRVADISALKGDLDWIVMKALEKDRRQRYESASALAKDVRRYLADEATEAAAPSAHYRARKFIRRHRGRVVVGAVLLAVCSLGVMGLAYSTLTIAESLQNTQAAERQAAQDRDRFRSERDRVQAALYVSDVRLAHEEWKHAHLAAIKRLLNAHLPRRDERDLRGWEWYYLAELIRGSSVTLGDKSSHFRYVTWSPDGRSLATADENHDVKIWDAINLRELRLLRGHSDLIFCVEWSRDSHRVASADGQGKIRISDVQTGSCSTIEAFHFPVRCVAWSPDGKQLACGGDGEVVQVWEIETGQKLLELPGHDALVWSVSWSPDGHRLASVDNYLHRTIRVWDVRSGKLLAYKSEAHNHAILSTSWSPNGKLLATSSMDGLVKIWNVDTWESRELRGHGGEVTSVRWRQDGLQLASSSTDGTIILWDADSGKSQSTLRGHEDSVRTICWSPDGRRLASASWDGTVRIWDRTRQQEYSHFSLDSLAAWSPDGRTLALISNRLYAGKPTIQLIDASTGNPTGKAIQLSDADPHWHPPVEWSSNGRLIAAGFTTLSDVGVAIVDVATHVELAKYIQPAAGQQAEIRSIAFSPDASLIAVAVLDGEKQRVVVWETATGAVKATLHTFDGFPDSIAWSPDGSRLAATSFDGALTIWNTVTWRRAMKLDRQPQDSRTGAGGPHLVSWNADGSLLAAGNVSGSVTIWDPATGRELLSFSAHPGKIFGVTFSPDGRRLATAGQDKCVKIWDASDGSHLLTLGGDDLPFRDVAWSPDGQRLLASGGSGHFIWTAPGAGRSEGK